MLSLKKVNILTITILITTLPALITRAAILPSQTAPVNQLYKTYVSLSWGEIVSFFQRHKVRRGGRGLFCGITPNQFLAESEQEASKEIWNNKPLFSWRVSDSDAKPVRIEIFEQGKTQVFETIDISRAQTRTTYNGRPLQAGKTYEWKLYILVGGARGRELESLPIEFDFMEASKRNTITQYLISDEARLQKQGASIDKIVLSKVDYLIKQGLLSDALQQLYSVQTPQQN